MDGFSPPRNKKIKLPVIEIGGEKVKTVNKIDFIHLMRHRQVLETRINRIKKEERDISVKLR